MNQLGDKTFIFVSDRSFASEEKHKLDTRFIRDTGSFHFPIRIIERLLSSSVKIYDSILITRKTWLVSITKSRDILPYDNNREAG